MWARVNAHEDAWKARPKNERDATMHLLYGVAWADPQWAHIDQSPAAVLAALRTALAECGRLSDIETRYDETMEWLAGRERAGEQVDPRSAIDLLTVDDMPEGGEGL